MSRAIIKTELMCKSFINDGQVNHVIKNMNLEIKENDFTVIMGSSGSGKSTLLYSLSGMMNVTSGEVELAGNKLSKQSETKMADIRREKIGFVFQGIHLVPDLTVYENILSPTYHTGKNRQEIEKKISELLEKMELTEHQRKFPGQLSGGQKQRVAICRALMNNPDIIFADEPTGALNSSQGKSVLDILTGIHESGQTIVMVTHDMKAALRGNRILYLKDGRIDGDLNLDFYNEKTAAEREKLVYEFLTERGW